LGFWLRFVSNAVSHEFARALRVQKISVPEWDMLRELFDLQVASSQKLGEMTGMTKGAVSKVIDRLLEKRLVSSTTSPLDQRVREIRLTPPGKQLVPVLAGLADQNDEKFFNHLSLKERQ